MVANTWLTAVFDRSRARGAARLVALALADRADDAGRCWPSVADIQRRAGLSTERAARRALAELAKLGELAIERGGGRWRTNKYRLTIPAPPDPPAPQTRTSAQGFPPERNPDNGAPIPLRAAPETPARRAPKPGQARTPNPTEPTVNPQVNPQTNGDSLCARTVAAALLPSDPERAAYVKLIEERNADAVRNRGGRTPRSLASVARSIVPTIASAPKPERRRRRIPEEEQARTKNLLLAAGVQYADAVDLARDGTSSDFERAIRLPAFATAKNPGGFLRAAVRGRWWERSASA